MTEKVQVKDLRVGDILSTGVITHPPRSRYKLTGKKDLGLDGIRKTWWASTVIRVQSRTGLQPNKVTLLNGQEVTITVHHSIASSVKALHHGKEIGYLSYADNGDGTAAVTHVETKAGWEQLGVETALSDYLRAEIGLAPSTLLSGSTLEQNA